MRSGLVVNTHTLLISFLTPVRSKEATHQLDLVSSKVGFTGFGTWDVTVIKADTEGTESADCVLGDVLDRVKVGALLGQSSGQLVDQDCTRQTSGTVSAAISWSNTSRLTVDRR